MRIHIPANYPPESLVLFVMSTWHVLIALFISRVGVLRREPAAASDVVELESGLGHTPSGAPV